ncbi:MAG: Ig domain-containing protein, partial [Bacteroidota bacterium]
TVIRVNAVSDPRITAATQLTVTAPRSVVISTPPSELFLGDEAQLTATVDVNDGESRAVEWSTSNPTVASITPGGKLIAVGLGTVTVRVRSAAFTSLQDSTIVSVRIPRSVSVSPGTTTLSPGQTRQMTATVVAEESLSKAVLWRSANPSVAMISSGGLITGVAPGTTTITAVLAADTTRRGTASITVVALVREVAVQPSAATVAIGETRQLTASVTADPGADRTIQWRSANPAVASVSNSGLVTWVSAGTAVVTAVSTADTTKQSTSTITVRTIPVVTVSPTSLTLSPTDVATLTATVQADAGVNTGVTWRTNNSAVATVNGSGQVTALANGLAVITAVSVADTTRSASASITVRTPPTVHAVSVTPSMSLLQIGQTVQLVPTV